MDVKSSRYLDHIIHFLFFCFFLIKLSLLTKIIFHRLTRPLDLPKLDKGLNCDVKGYKMGGAITEQLRRPRIVRVAIIQHKIVLPTTAPIRDQRDAIFKTITAYIDHAAKGCANVVCMQEGWSK